MTKSVDFFVAGNPKTAGSKRAFVRASRTIVVDTCDNKDWKAALSLAGGEAMKEQQQELYKGPLCVEFRFYLRRPNGHYNKKGMLQRRFDGAQPVKKPDLLKLARCAEDALTGVIWRDDAQIVSESLQKDYTSSAPGLQVLVRCCD